MKIVLPKSIVVVEDEMMAQRYLKDILENLGIERVETFTTGEDALEWLNLVKCDLLVADINLKGSIDGIQMAKKILEKYDIPIIFITGYSDADTVNEALSTSPFGYIVKPFSQSDIELQVRVGYQKFLDYKNKSTKDSRVFSESSKMIKINDTMEFSLTNSTLYKDGKPIYLPHKQNELVVILCKNLNNVVSYDQLEYLLWQDEAHANSALRTLVYSIRNIIPELHIVSHSKIGYSLKSL